PPDINESQLRFTVEPETGVRFGLAAIKNVGEGAIESLLAVRAKQGRIASLSALCEEIDLRLVNKRVFESLTKSGAFDSLATGTQYESLPSAAWRPRLMAAIDAACEHGARMQEDRERGQGGLFGPSDEEAAGAAADGVVAFAVPEAAPWSEIEQLSFEEETLGRDWNRHPVDRCVAAVRDVRLST